MPLQETLSFWILQSFPSAQAGEPRFYSVGHGRRGMHPPQLRSGDSLAYQYLGEVRYFSWGFFPLGNPVRKTLN